jgi:preprotein translocase subunit SecF
MGINPYNENFESGGYFFNAINRDITIVRGDTMSFGFEVQGLGGEIPSAIYFTAKETAESSDNLFVLSLQDHITIRDYDSETDIYTFGLRLPPDKTYNLDLGRYFYDLEIQVNQDIFTILRGRLELVADITRGGAPSPTPQHESGDDIAYPVENIPLGSVKLYTEQTISDIAQGVLEVLGEDEPIIPAEIVNKIDDIKEIIDEQITLPDDYHIEYGGQFESEQAASQTLMITSIFSILAIYLLLYNQFRSPSQAAVIMLNLPLALIGGVFVIFFTSGVVSIPSIIGFISLFGIATRNGMLLVDRYNDLVAGGMSVKEAVIHGSLDRLNPIVMTALTSALALIPLALGGALPGNEIQSPMAQVILGGLLSSTLLNGFVIPIIYLMMNKKTNTSVEL